MHKINYNFQTTILIFYDKQTITQSDDNFIKLSNKIRRIITLNKYYSCQNSDLLMLQNPQIKFDGMINKAYLFPKYQGKFFVVKNQKITQNKLNHFSFSPKPIKFNLQSQIFSKQDYRQLKVQAQYTKKIQQLKKKLQREISKYNKEKDKKIKLTNKLDQLLQGEYYKLSNSVSYRLQSDESKIQRTERSKQQERSTELRKMKRRYAFRIPLKNSTEIKRRIKTDIESSERSNKNNVETEFFTNRSNNSLNSKQSNHLPLIQVKQVSPESKNTFSISSSIRYSLPSRVFKNQTKNKMQHEPEGKQVPRRQKSPQKQIRMQTEVLNKLQRYDSVNQHLKMRAMGIGLGKRNNSKIKKKEPHFRQTFLNGWEYSHQKQADQLNYMQ